MSVAAEVNLLQSELLRRQFPGSGWAALASSSQAALEPTCYALLATQDTAAFAGAKAFLLRAQSSNGSWPVFLGDNTEGSWVTSLVTIALRDDIAAIPARLNGFHWLLETRGKEASWLWRWKFRTTDRQVRFDPDKHGWPWIPDTLSWVVPTAFAILALRQLPCTCGGFEQLPGRIENGIRMLLDRACPTGGWNAGNGVVYGEPVAPHPDDTAVALLALCHQTADPVVQQALRYLEAVALRLTSPWSLAWAALALAANHRPIAALQAALAALPDLARTEDTSTLALACLALDHERSLASFGVDR